VKPEELAELFHDEIARLELCDLLDLYWDWYTHTHTPTTSHVYTNCVRLYGERLIADCAVFAGHCLGL
jgi:hypothetical protein